VEESIAVIENARAQATAQEAEEAAVD